MIYTHPENGYASYAIADLDVITAEQARDLLNDVSKGTFTEWSAVYNLSDFSVDLYVDRHYEHPYHYG